MNIHSEADENACDISPLIDSALMGTSYTDPENLIAKHVANINPIGMANFKSKSPRLKAKSKLNNNINNTSSQVKRAPVKKESKLNLNLSASIASNKSLAFQRWQLAVIKLKYQKDPWSEFHLENCAEEKVIRHRYNPIRKEWKLDACVVKMEPKQFANGAMRACFRLKKLSNFSHEKSWQTASNYVAKSYMDPEIPRERYFDDVRLQMDAKLWAEIYNRHHPPKKIDMFQVSILEFKDRPNSSLFHLEHFIEGKYVKYNSNAGFVEDAHLRNTPHAFSHFTFERSSHELMVVDIQGVDDLYTDPQIHTANGKDYGDGNLGTKGFALFFYSHVCNEICKSLGLTEFDLAPSETKSHDKIIGCMQKFCHTKIKGNEEPVSNQTWSARSRYLSNRYNSIGENSNHLSEIEESDGYFSSSPSPLISPNVMINGSNGSIAATNASIINSNSNSVTNNFNISSSNLNPFAQNFGVGARSLSNQSGDTSMLDSAFENEEAHRYLNNKAFNKPRPSAVFLEKDAMLNADTEFHRKSSASSHLYESVLGNIHLDMCKYHEIGRFVSHEEEELDKEAAFFHLVQAANLGVTEALVNVAKIYLQLPHDILPEYKVDDSDENFSTGFEYMLEAAEKGDKSSLYYVAKAYDTGIGLSKNESIDWSKAVEFYRKILGEEHGDEKSNDGAGNGHDITAECDASYSILARIAQIYLDGGHNVDQNFQEAADLFNEAAETAMQSGKGRLANKYYMLAEEANSQT